MTISHKPDEFVPNTFMCYLPEDADTNTFVILYSQNGCRYNKPTAFKGKALLVTPNILELEYDKVTQFALYINSNMSSFTIQQKRRNPKDFKFSLAGFKDARIWKHLYLESIEN